jgi:hypothetical protein
VGTLHTSELYRHGVSLHQKLCREDTSALALIPQGPIRR